MFLVALLRILAGSGFKVKQIISIESKSSNRGGMHQGDSGSDRGSASADSCSYN